MKVILLENIKGLGQKNDVKNVADGYAKNFLIPRELAKIATENLIKDLEVKKVIQDKREQEIKQKLTEAAKNLNSVELVFFVKTGEKGEVFESVNKKMIENKIDEIFNKMSKLKNYNDWKINFEKPLKTLGEHFIEINFGKGIKGKIKIKLQPLS